MSTVHGRDRHCGCTGCHKPATHAYNVPATEHLPPAGLWPLCDRHYEIATAATVSSTEGPTK